MTQKVKFLSIRLIWKNNSAQINTNTDDTCKTKSYQISMISGLIVEQIYGMNLVSSVPYSL
jgi:hypothetical protein